MSALKNEIPHLSIVIPAYNEVNRLPKTLERMMLHLAKVDFSFEILISDDGSKDKTVATVQEMMKRFPQIRVISDGINRGRGAAVKRGIFDARGELILETDADGSVGDEAIGRFVKKMDDHKDIDAIFGSRAMDGARIAVWQPPFRVFLGYGFLYLSKLLFWMWSTTDFTLGFKMYRRAASHDIFSHQFDAHYVAEAEKVFVAKLRGHTAIELPVEWTDDPNSRVHPVRDSFRSLKGIGMILVRTLLGKYR